MEAKTEQKKLIVLKKPQGEISIYASYDMMKWGVDDYGKKYVKWGEKEWLLACPKEKEEEKEEKKRKRKNKWKKKNDLLFFLRRLFFFAITC